MYSCELLQCHPKPADSLKWTEPYRFLWVIDLCVIVVERRAMSFVVPPPPVPSVFVDGAEAGVMFPVHRIYCVGRNYADHAKEMGGTGRESPFFFMKPADAVLPLATGQQGLMHYPALTHDLHHEVELVVAIGLGGRDISVAEAMVHVWGYAVGLDMTRRDLQSEAKKLGRPWCIGKGFDESAPLSPVRAAKRCKLMPSSSISLDVNGGKRQYGVIGQMIWSIPEIIAQLSAAWELVPGDLIFTGTPAGVAAVVPGDRMDARIDGVGSLQVQVINR